MTDDTRTLSDRQIRHFLNGYDQGVHVQTLCHRFRISYTQGCAILRANGYAMPEASSDVRMVRR